MDVQTADEDDNFVLIICNLLFRIQVDNECKISSGDKFGCDFEKEAVLLLKEAASLRLNVVGVAFHVGSLCSSLESYVTGLQRARALFDHEDRAGRGMKIVDIGGGFFSERTDNIDQASKLVNAAVEELFPDQDFQVISKPGSYGCDSSFTMSCIINNVRKVKMINDTSNNAAFVLRDHSPEDVAKAMILGQQNEPFFIFDMDEAYRRIQHFKQELPRVQILYAMKAYDNEMMLKLAVATGLGFDCASIHEIYKILCLNVPPTNIIYAVTMKTPEQMIYARESGVRRATFDSPSELVKLKNHWPDVELLIRISIKSESVYKLDLKFGCDSETEATDLLDTAASLGLRVVGVAFHVGSTCLSPDSYLAALNQARYLFDYEAKAGRRMDVLDIGGGFFCDDNLFEQATRIIRAGLNELFPDPNVLILAEPGRYLCETACNLYCNINNVKTITKNNKPLNMIYINDGLHGTLRSFESWHTINKFELQTKKEEVLEDTVILGPTLDPRDCLTDVQLPRCTPSDWLVFKTQGAYASTFDSQFCGFGLVQTRSVMSFDLWNIVKSHQVFRPSDFVLNADVTSPLPSTIPPVIPADPCTQKHFNILTD